MVLIQLPCFSVSLHLFSVQERAMSDVCGGCTCHSLGQCFMSLGPLYYFVKYRYIGTVSPVVIIIVVLDPNSVCVL